MVYKHMFINYLESKYTTYAYKRIHSRLDQNKLEKVIHCQGIIDFAADGAFTWHEDGWDMTCGADTSAQVLVGTQNLSVTTYSTNHVYLHRPNAFGFWQMRLHLCYETLKRISNFSELA